MYLKKVKMSFIEEADDEKEIPSNEEAKKWKDYAF